MARVGVLNLLRRDEERQGHPKRHPNTARNSMFLAADLTRPVVVFNPTTSEEEIRLLNEIASSHLASRCFIGNLYKVKDPNLVSVLNGHKEGSKAFSRYREIDE